MDGIERGQAEWTGVTIAVGDFSLHSAFYPSPYM